MEYSKLLDNVIQDQEDDAKKNDAGKTTFGRGCKNFNTDCRQALIDYAENKKDCGHTCEYCNTFKWAIDRAKQYGQKLNIPWKEIMSEWDKNMNYWYMNYYQENNQPRIDAENVYIFESIEEANKAVGKEFICPCCKGISTNPYECNSGKKISKDKVCDWKSYGLLQFDLAYIYCKKERTSTKCFMPKSFINTIDTSTVKANKQNN